MTSSTVVGTFNVASFVVNLGPSCKTRPLLERLVVRGWRRPEAAGPQLGPAGVCILLVLAVLVLFVAEAQAFGLEDVASRAATLAAASYQKSGGALPGDVKGLNYDQHRDIRFRPERALWRNTKLPFEIMFFHPGWVYEDVVAIHEITPEGIRDVKFDPEAFDPDKVTQRLA